MLSYDQISELCLKLASLLHASVGYRDAARLLRPRDPAVKKVVDVLGGADGEELSEALERTGEFPAYVTGLVRTGEQAGKTEETLQALSTYYNRQYVRARQVRSALLYPSILLLLMLVVVAVLLIKVLPVFDSVYASLGGEMTGLAGGLLHVGQWLAGVAPILCGLLAAAAVAVSVAAGNEQVRATLVRAWQTRFGDRGVSKKINTAKLAQALSLSLEAGMPLDEAMERSAELVSDVPAVRKRCLACAERLRSDERLTDALFESGLLPDTACELLALGQQSGGADLAMAEIANRLSFEADQALDGLVSRVEPAMLVLTSLLIGMILLSVMLPLMDIMAAIC